MASGLREAHLVRRPGGVLSSQSPQQGLERVATMRLDLKQAKADITRHVLVLLFILAQMGICQESDENTRKRTSYYDSWVGVKAPEIGSAAVDRTTGPAVRLKAFSGKRVLLFSFDSGDFRRQPDE